ncbi:MAG TPA: transcriptional repressor LexA [Planctomycetota bacterium]|nr:transcriptional repressor LexA [Planctomycetota bacterium]
MTPKQLEVLRFVEDFTQRNGYSPTLQEVADHLKITKVTVLSHLRQLEKSRHIKRSYYRRRGIEVLTSTRRLPVTGRIAAGKPIEAIVHPDELDVLGVMKAGKDYFALEVRGNSMIEDHIRDGDYVIVERTPAARNGETVVALLDDGEATLKRFYKENGRIRLQPANGTMAPIVVDRVDVQGVVVGVFRKL